MYIALLVLLIAANAFFAMTEIAVLSTNMKKIKRIADKGDKKALIILKISEVPEKFLATIQVGVTLSGFLASAVAADNFVSMLTPYVSSLPISTDLLQAVLLIIVTVVLSYFTLIFGELVPKRLALKNPETISLMVAPFVWYFYHICKPFVAFLAASTNLVLKLLGVDGETEEDAATEEAVMQLVQEGEEQGYIENEEHRMIKNIFKLDDKRVSEVMTHRLNMVSISDTLSIEEALNIVIESGYSRVPVYGKDIDNILGMVYAKDLLCLIGDCDLDKISIESYIREVSYIHEWKLCDDLLREMKSWKRHCAIVVDEYGGTIGLVTLEDLLEVIVGDIEDEYDDDDTKPVLSEGTFLLDGSMPLDEVEELLGETLGSKEDFETLGGLIIATLDRIPKEGENASGTIGKYQFEVVSIRGQKLESIKLIVC